MSLTLNISKQAKFFYQNEQKNKEHLESIQPSSTIFMKKYSSNRKKRTISPNRNYLSGSSEEELSDEESNQHQMGLVFFQIGALVFRMILLAYITF